MPDHIHAPPCDAASDLLPDLAAGRLGATDRDRVSGHVAGCARCAAELTLLRAARGALRAEAPHVDLAAVAARVRAATVGAASVPADAGPAPALVRTPLPGVERGPPPSIRATARRWSAGRVRALAAAVLLAVGTGAAWIGRSTPDRAAAVATRDELRAADTASVPTGATRRTDRRVATPAGSAPPTVLAAADPGLGARFDDLTDDELLAVIAAVEADELALPSAEPESVAPAFGEGG
jgi:hypothetical protein